MERDEIKSAVIEILEDTVPDADLSDVKDDVSIREQIEMDSMDFLDLILGLKMKYKLDVPESDYGNFTTMNSTLEYLEPKLKD